MKKLTFILTALISSTALMAQDQTVNGTLFQNLNNQWLSPAKIQIGRLNTDIIKDKAVIGVTNGNLHLDSYPGFGLYLNYYQEGSSAGNKGILVAPNGNVGIGTVGPTQKLDVRGSQYLNGTLFVSPTTGNYTEGIRVAPSTNNWATIALGAIGNSGTNENMWSIHRKDNNDFSISRNSSDGGNGMVITKAGNIGFGTVNPSAKLEVNGDIKGNKLDINGTIRSKEVKIEATGWSDFVFSEDYKLPTLSEVESHIKEHKHLPDVPSEKQVIKEGVNVVEMQAKLLQKIEELTLYTIQLEKKYDAIKDELKSLKQDKH